MWHFGSKTMNKGLRNGAGVLDERETQQCRSLIDTALNDGQEMASEIRAVADANWARELEGLRSTSCGWIYSSDHLLETYSSTQQIVALSTAESDCISTTKGATHALEVRNAMEFGMTFNVVCEMDVTVGRATAARRGVGRVRHLDARLLWLQRLWAEGVPHWCLRSSRPGEHHKADLELKKIDSTLHSFDHPFHRVGS